MRITSRTVGAQLALDGPFPATATRRPPAGEIAGVIDEVGRAETHVDGFYRDLLTLVVLPLLAGEGEAVVELVHFVEDGDDHLHTLGGGHLGVGRVGRQAVEKGLEQVLKGRRKPRNEVGHLPFESLPRTAGPARGARSDDFSPSSACNRSFSTWTLFVLSLPNCSSTALSSRSRSALICWRVSRSASQSARVREVCCRTSTHFSRVVRVNSKLDSRREVGGEADGLAAGSSHLVLRCQAGARQQQQSKQSFQSPLRLSGGRDNHASEK